MPMEWMNICEYSTWLYSTLKRNRVVKHTWPISTQMFKLLSKYKDKPPTFFFVNLKHWWVKMKSLFESSIHSQNCNGDTPYSSSFQLENAKVHINSQASSFLIWVTIWFSHLALKLHIIIKPSVTDKKHVLNRAQPFFRSQQLVSWSKTLTKRQQQLQTSPKNSHQNPSHAT